MRRIWTVAGDETSWSEWAKRMSTSSASETVKKLASDLSPGSQQWAIDIGCGTGRSFTPLIENGYQVLGIDPTYEAVKASKKRSENEGLSAHPVLAAANQLPIRNGSVKAVFVIGTIFHLNPFELEDALLEIKRVLWIGGEAILHFLDSGDWRKRLGEQLLDEDIPKPSYRAVVTCFCSEEEIRKMIENAGLIIKRDFQKVQEDEEGERREWFFHCVRLG
jgi:ubiquinone/menaquinone biosynthesis C-methylase UbiE